MSSVNVRERSWIEVRGRPHGQDVFIFDKDVLALLEVGRMDDQAVGQCKCIAGAADDNITGHTYFSFSAITDYVFAHTSLRNAVGAFDHGVSRIGRLQDRCKGPEVRDTVMTLAGGYVWQIVGRKARCNWSHYPELGRMLLEGGYWCFLD